jgi:hypothetical protein
MVSGRHQSLSHLADFGLIMHHKYPPLKSQSELLHNKTTFLIDWFQIDIKN